jgi:tRNA pseudouridine55 synthase
MVRRLTGERRVGHAGTLDPAATGVLPVCLGQGTRVIEFWVDATKTYRAQIELGLTTDTYDATGKVVAEGDASAVTRQQLEKALASFRGLIQQTPPMYSALKRNGRPLYKLARAGISVERESREVNIHSLELVAWQSPVVTIEVVCGKGTYIRSLAQDLGQILGCGAHLKSLTRSRCGLFDIEDAISPSRFEDAFHSGYWQHFVYPMDIVLSHWSAMVVDSDTERVIRNGGSVDCTGQCYPESPSAGERCRVYNPDGCFLGVLRFDPEGGYWQPEKVFQ